LYARIVNLIEPSFVVLKELLLLDGFKLYRSRSAFVSIDKVDPPLMIDYLDFFELEALNHGGLKM